MAVEIKYVIFLSAYVMAWIACSWLFMYGLEAPIRDKVAEYVGNGYESTESGGDTSNGYWTTDVRLWSTRCVLKCHHGYKPSGCHVLRRRYKNSWNHPEPLCIEAFPGSKPLFIFIWVCIGAIGAVVLYCNAFGFEAAMVVMNSVKVYLQESSIAVGGWYVLCQIAVQATFTIVSTGLLYIVLTACEDE